MFEIEGVVKLVPVPKAVPPVATLNQLNVPSLAVAINVTVPSPHRPAGVVLVMFGIVLMVAITGTRSLVQVAVLDET